MKEWLKEWPLVVFTLAIQLACGLALAAAVADDDALRPLALAIFPVAALGLLASLAHLGRPRMSWRALSNLRRSPLSREVLLTAVFAALAAADSALWWSGRSEGRWILGLATSAAGVASVVAAAAVYRIPAKPVWNSGWVMLSFLGTTVLLGGLFPALLMPVPLFLDATVVGSTLLLMAALWMLLRSPDVSVAPWMACYVALVSAVPVSMVLRLAPALVVGAAVAATASGRALLYRVGSRCPPF